jgi:hypothetical protein
MACAATTPAMPKRISVPDFAYLSVAPELGAGAALVPLVLPVAPPLVCTGLVLLSFPLVSVTELEGAAPVVEPLVLIVRKVLVPPSVGSDLDNAGPPGSDTLPMGVLVLELPVGRGAKVEPEGKIGVMDCALDGITRIVPNRKRAEREVRRDFMMDVGGKGCSAVTETLVPPIHLKMDSASSVRTSNSVKVRSLVLYQNLWIIRLS